MTYGDLSQALAQGVLTQLIRDGDRVAERSPGALPWNTALNLIQLWLNDDLTEPAAASVETRLCAHMILGKWVRERLDYRAHRSVPLVARGQNPIATVRRLIGDDIRNGRLSARWCEVVFERDRRTMH